LQGYLVAPPNSPLLATSSSCSQGFSADAYDEIIDQRK
jgi:hypothetical protein